MNEQIRGLQDLSQLILDAELAELRRLAEETRRYQDEIARLGASVTQRSAELGEADSEEDLAFQTGRDAAWLDWLARERARLARLAAETAARREAQRKRARRAFGQVDALARLRALDEEERRTSKARRALAEGDGSALTERGPQA